MYHDSLLVSPVQDGALVEGDLQGTPAEEGLQLSVGAEAVRNRETGGNAITLTDR